MSCDPETPDGGNSPDMVSPAADWTARERKAEQARERERAQLADLLRAKGVERVEAGYDGYGDSGNVNHVAVSPKEIEIKELDTRLADFIWATAYNLNPGFEIDDGGEGTLTWDVVKDRIDVRHVAFIYESFESVHEDV
ncbi:MAG: hypothetical protein F4Y60_00495 [Boseongicola sp. SB0664_bin_43]|uniref:Uncharacterized protein n=1 Tax=Boseongicola sp. SB0664_bin_43 TaxID=2604844 RepID=A0A6B0XYA5_9RHOB|nr:hypothetical protein [Boseongicola sp. SB0664_bin_43]